MHPVHEVVVVVECRMPADSARHKSPIVLLLQPTFLAAAVCCRCCALLGACNFVFSSVRPGRCRVWSRRGSCAAVHSPSLSRAQSVCLSVCLSGCRSPVILSGDECARHLPRDRLPTALPLAPSSSSLIFRGNRTRTQPLLNRPLSSSLCLLSLSLSLSLYRQSSLSAVSLVCHSVAISLRLFTSSALVALNGPVDAKKIISPITSFLLTLVLCHLLTFHFNLTHPYSAASPSIIHLVQCPTMYYQL